jgi:septal ring factor EnvC (AmiA/AmiB activator)
MENTGQQVLRLPMGIPAAQQLLAEQKEEMEDNLAQQDEQAQQYQALQDEMQEKDAQLERLREQLAQSDADGQKAAGLQQQVSQLEEQLEEVRLQLEQDREAAAAEKQALADDRDQQARQLQEEVLKRD